MLDLAILGLLEGREELHGYEIRRRLRDQLGLVVNVSFGSLYPALARLERAGAVEATTPGRRRQDPPPPTGSLSGERAVLLARRLDAGSRRRSRRLYRITPAGSALFAQLLRQDATEDARDFALRWAFARHLSPAGRRDLLERRRRVLLERLADVEATDVSALDAYAASVVEHAAASIRHDLAWLSSLEEEPAPAATDTTKPRARQAKEPR